MVRLASLFWAPCRHQLRDVELERVRAKRLLEVQALLNEIAAPRSPAEQPISRCC